MESKSQSKKYNGGLEGKPDHFSQTSVDQSKECDVIFKTLKKEGINHMNRDTKESPRFIRPNIKQDTFKQSTAISV